MVKADEQIFENDCFTYVRGTSSVDERDTNLKCSNLEEGTYFIGVEIDWN